MELTLNLNARLQPKHRHELEDALQEILKQEGLGDVTGGGTLQNTKTGEIISCDIDISLGRKQNIVNRLIGILNKIGILKISDEQDNINRLVEILNKIGIPKGSELSCVDHDINIKVGTLEGLAYYGNGTDLPTDVYENCDINHVIEQFESAMKGIGGLYSYWESNEWTALYFYGTSFEEMKQRIEPFIASYPLCQKCRIEQIA